MDTIADLMLLEMTVFGVILGMDWLASCHATLDCHDKAIKFNMPREPSFVFQGEQSKVPRNLISLMNARRLLQKCCQGFLVFVRNVEKEESKLEDVLVVQEFVDVFPDDLSGIPPDHEVDLICNMVLGHHCHHRLWSSAWFQAVAADLFSVRHNGFRPSPPASSLDISFSIFFATWIGFPLLSAYYLC